MKRALFRELDAAAPPDAVLASSSSALRTSLFTETLAGRGRCLVVHPVNPPYLLPLVELSPAPWTAPETVERARVLMEEVGQVPVTLRREIPGFLLNRLQGALLQEAFRLVDQGYASMEDIDHTIKNGLGLRWSFMGPFETIDLNAPGGIADYLRRYGPAYHEMATSAGAGAPQAWSAELIARIETERRAAQPMTGLGERETWRDRRLMALLVHKRKAARADRRITDRGLGRGAASEAVRALLRPVAAHLHLAPAAALVLGDVEEQPAAMLAAALLDARHVGLCKERQRGERDRPENGLGEP